MTQLTALILIPCTNRKRQSPELNLRARSLSAGSLESLAKIWTERVNSAAVRLPARSVYAGRSFQEALKASHTLGSELHIVSAGLGIVSVDQKVPAYSLTISPIGEDAILTKADTVDAKPCDWWHALSQHTATGQDLSHLLSCRDNNDLVLMALSASYAQLIYRDLENLPQNILPRLRIFGLGLERHLPDKLHRFLMPYDRRLDGPDSPIPGTVSDFATRALAHFARMIKDDRAIGANSKDDSIAVDEELSRFGTYEVPVRKPCSDEEIEDFIERNWDKVTGRSTKMLRLLRDSGFACEQGRFKEIFNKKKEERQLSLLATDA